MEFAIIPNADSLRSSDLLVDSALQSGVEKASGARRIDHHVDGGWTMIDSLTRVDWENLLESVPDRICCTYLDPDAIIGTALIVHALKTQHAPFAESPQSLLEPMYSASFWCDYSTGCPGLDPRINRLGSKIELWLRYLMEASLNTEDRHSKVGDYFLRRSAAYGPLVHRVSESWSRDALADECLDLDDVYELALLRETFKDCVRRDLSTESIGVIVVQQSHRRVIPRAYLGLFDQPIVARVIQRTGDPDSPKQIMVGINPHVDDWETLNIELLVSKLPIDESIWRPTGRRAVVGANTSAPLVDILRDLNTACVEDCRDQCTNWSGITDSWLRAAPPKEQL